MEHTNSVLSSIRIRRAYLNTLYFAGAGLLERRDGAGYVPTTALGIFLLDADTLVSQLSNPHSTELRGI